MLVGSYDLLNEVSDEKRFYKNISAALMQVRNGLGDALFTVRVKVGKRGNRLTP